jgi:hypothetical protein
MDGTDTRKCIALRRDGEPCGGQALPTENKCWAHSDTLAEKRDAARRRGGANTAKSARLQRLMPRDLRPVFDALALALEQVHAGELDHRRATAMASVATAMVRVLSAGEFEARLRALEEETRGGVESA